MRIQPLKQEIVQGRLGFGAILSPRQLGREMGMSFLPIADALTRLESEGLVETRDRVGTRVRIPTVEDIEGIFIVREALESQAARLCAERATPEQRRQLKLVSSQVDERYAEANQGSVSLKDWLETTNLHVAFHRMIADFAGCPRLREAIEKSQVLTFKIQFDNALRRKKTSSQLASASGKCSCQRRSGKSRCCCAHPCSVRNVRCPRFCSGNDR
jgi:DNA-binding GntR family transcriptional regulator